MDIRICLEEMEGRWIAHAIDLPGCFVTRDDREEALAAAPAAIQEYVAWRRAHGDESPLPDGPFQLKVEEMFREWQGPERPDYDVSAFFAGDAPPLTLEEMETIRWLLIWSRADLLDEVAELSAEALIQEVEDGWAIQDILVHVGRSECGGTWTGWGWRQRILGRGHPGSAGFPSPGSGCWPCCPSWWAWPRWSSWTVRSGPRARCCAGPSGTSGITFSTCVASNRSWA